ncbi:MULTISPECIES: NAD-dependent epimerase/dehydratase family protein [unclassified Sphingopyxis]|jgi:nucleoside-diphosphate-sugar epimerase|uniref:NAD-dependent epimerase/dehydratase family protein n=1 Tax=unclassified Sphingopyxis TaxID=2614943 RepID=UPI0025D07051|nr:MULTISPECIES: NAD-dependent epimerase/dehydratase family protein [unclassified Sphingopyxis]
MTSADVNLITGAAGFVGRRLVEALRAQGQEVYAWTRNDGDLRDSEVVRAALGQIRPTCVYHLASTPPGSGDENWYRIADEQQMVANLAYALPDQGRLIYAGSMAEYGQSGTLFEYQQCTPDTCYGCAKFSASTLALSLRMLHGFDIRVARLFGVYGPGEASARLLPTLIAKLGRGEAVALSDGAQLRDFIHIDDVCSLLARYAAEPMQSAPAVSNIGTGEGISVRQVCERVAEVMGADSALLRFGAIPRRSVDKDRLVANVDQMKLFAPVPPQRWLDHDLSEAVVRSMAI